MSRTEFSTDTDTLKNILEQVNKGEIRLPDFQRGWVWDDQRIVKIISSILQSFPIGVIMLLETGGETRFKPKLVEGVGNTNLKSAKKLVLDGQQRITSLFQALFTEDPVETENKKGNPIKRHYFLDIKKYLNVDPDQSSEIENCILSIPEDLILKGKGREVKLDLSDEENEFRQMFFPLNKTFEFSKWRRRFNRFWDNSDEKSELIDRFEELSIERIKEYKIAVIEIKNSTKKDAICKIFEYVNTGGVKLDVFELLTATFAADDFSLRDDWEQVVSKLASSKFRVYKNNEFDKDIQINPTSFLQVISLLSTYERRKLFEKTPVPGKRPPAVSCKKDAILSLTLEDYQKYSDDALFGLMEAAKFLYDKHIYSFKNIPYTSQIVPLSTILAKIKDNRTNRTNTMLERWFWCGIFGEMYGGANETRYSNDLTDFLGWVETERPISTITESQPKASKIDTLYTRNSSAYKGIIALLMDQGARDFITGAKLDSQVYFDETIDIHHIFPSAWCEKNEDTIAEGNWYNSIVNKSAISSRSNRRIGGNAPSIYLGKIESLESFSDSKSMDEILESHLINPVHLRSNDYNSFYADRKEKIIKAIEKVTNKKVLREEEE